MTTPFIDHSVRRRRWSWLSFAVGIVVGVVGFFALGSVLFSDDISTALEEEKGSGSAVEQVQTIAAQMTTCDPHGRSCHFNNMERVNEIDLAMPERPSGLNNALVSFRTEYGSFTGRGCGRNTSNAICGLTGLNLNLAVSTVKAEVLALE